MRKCLAILFLLIYEISSGQVDNKIVADITDISNDSIDNNAAKFSSKKFDIIVHRDSRMPIILVSVVFPVGRCDVPIGKGEIVEIIGENLINSDLKQKLLELGILYDVRCTNGYTEILAEIHPNNIKKFLELAEKITDSLNIDNFEFYKQKVILKNKVALYEKDNIISDNELSYFCPNLVFNENSAQSITEKEVMDFFEKNYKNKKALVIICGNCDESISTNINTAKDKNAKDKEAITTSNIHKEYISKKIDHRINIENKYVSNAVRYSYVISDSKDREFLREFIVILWNMIYRDLAAARRTLNYFDIRCVQDRQYDILQISLYPKKDVSLDEIKHLYNLLIKKVASIGLSDSKIKEIAGEQKTSFNVMLSDLYKITNRIRDSYLRGNSPFDTSHIIENMSSENITNFTKKNMLDVPLFEVTTQYRADR